MNATTAHIAHIARKNGWTAQYSGPRTSTGLDSIATYSKESVSIVVTYSARNSITSATLTVRSDHEGPLSTRVGGRDSGKFSTVSVWMETDMSDTEIVREAWTASRKSATALSTAVAVRNYVRNAVENAEAQYAAQDAREAAEARVARTTGSNELGRLARESVATTMAALDRAMLPLTANGHDYHARTITPTDWFRRDQDALTAAKAAHGRTVNRPQRPVTWRIARPSMTPEMVQWEADHADHETIVNVTGSRLAQWER